MAEMFFMFNGSWEAACLTEQGRPIRAWLATERSGDATGACGGRRSPSSLKHTKFTSSFDYFAKPQGAASPNVPTFDLEGQQNGTESSSCSSSIASSVDGPECRICLSVGDARDLVQPCSCSGTLSYTRTACLSAWVHERGSLVCELCRQRYKEPHAQQLETVAAATAASKRLDTQDTATTLHADQLGRSKWSVAFVLLSVLVAVVVFVVVTVMMILRPPKQASDRRQGP